LGRKQLTKLKVVVGATHTHEAQKPEALTLKF
jgi:ribosomal protein L13